LKPSLEQCSKFSELLDNAHKYIEELESELKAEKAHSKDIYHELRNECRAQQCASKQKDVLKDRISGLVESKQKIMEEVKELQKHSAQHVDVLEADNECLQRELSSSLECYTKELACTREKLKLSRTALTGSKSEVYNLKQKCARAAAVKKSAVKKARSQVLKEKTTFYLLKKGVYSKETRNLVHILVQANVSAKNIMAVIKAVLAAAGITAV
jgi:chromosome segregation ATPase